MASSISEEIRKSVRDGLSLQCDAKLLQYMELISNRLINRAKTTSKNIETMSSELQRTSISLDNVTNSLSSLSHTKFIENRVYDDDETIANIKEVPVEIKTKEYNPIKTLNTVIRNNMKMLDNCYEKVSVELYDTDDDEEEEEIKSIVYRPKNKFESRPIPHLIGSKEWKENWHIGLYDSDESFSDNENEEFSDGSDSLSLPSNGPTISESGSSLWSINHNSKNILPNKKIDYTSSEEEISTTSKTSSNDNKQKYVPQISSVHEQRFYVHQPKERRKGLFDDSSESEKENNRIYEKQNKELKFPEPLPRKSQQQSVGSNKISNIFIDEPPELNDSVQQINNIKSQSFFDNDEGELFNENAHKVQNSIQISKTKLENVRKKTVNLFDDDDFNSFMEELDKKTNEKTSNVANRNVNLFDDQTKDDVESHENKKEIFDTKHKLSFGKNEKETNSINNSKLNTNTIVSVPNSNKIEKNISTLFEEEDNIFSSSTKPIHKFTEKSTFDKSISKTNFANLFDDTPPDDEFDNLFKASSKVSKNGNSNSPDLFASDIQETITQIPTNPISLNKNIFNDDTIEEDMNILEKPRMPPVNFAQNKNDHKEVLSQIENTYNIIPTDKMNNQWTSNNEQIIKKNYSIDNNLFGEPTVEKSKNILNNNSNEINDNTNVDDNKEILNIQSNKKHFSNSIFDDVPEDDNDLFNSLALANNQNDKTENSIKNEDPNLQTAQTKRNLDFENLKNNNLLSNDVLINSAASYENISELSINEENYKQNPEESIVDSNLLQNESLTVNVDQNIDSKFSKYPEIIEKNEDLIKTDEGQKAESDLNIDIPVSEVPTFTSHSSSKSSIHSVFMPTIFDDIPPDDDDIFSSSNKQNLNEAEIFEATTDIYNFNKSQTISNISNYDSVFQDTSPPDDRSSHNTLADQINHQKDFNTNFIFDSEPPTDSYLYEKDDIAPSMKCIEPKTFDEKSLSVSDMVKQVSTVNKDNDTKYSKSKPSLISKKLSTNLNINVAALLPGAKRPSLQIIIKDESDGNISTKTQILNKEEELKTGGSPKKFVEEDPTIVIEDQPMKEQLDRLISLNKTRVTIPKRRHPSTKKGRLENYRKSLVNIENEDQNNIFLDKPNSQLSSKKHPEEKLPNLFTDISYDDNDSDLLFKKSTKSNLEDKVYLNNKLKAQPDNELPKKLDDFEKSLPNSVLKELKETTTISKNSSVENELKCKVESTSDRYNDEIMYKTNSKLIEKGFVIKPETEKFNNFLFDDENDLFSDNSLLTTTKNENKKNMTEKDNKSTEKLLKVENEHEVFKKIKIYKKKSSKNELSLVDDKIEKVSKTATKAQSKSKGLFDSDDDGDDLFKNNSTIKKINSIKDSSLLEANKNFLNVPKRNNLFDEDDDDDLFGTKASKGKTAVTKKNIEKPKIVQTQGASTDYNPLADLLIDK